MSSEDRSSTSKTESQLIRLLQEVGPDLVHADDELMTEIGKLNAANAVKVLQDLGLEDSAAQNALRDAGGDLKAIIDMSLRPLSFHRRF